MESASYKQIWRLTIRPVLGSEPAFDVARRFYAQFPDMNFEEDFVWYLRNGFVVNRPTIFAMGKVVERHGERMWFIQAAAGSLIELIHTLPFYLPRICFVRDNDGVMREWSIKRLFQLAYRQAVKEEQRKAA